MKENSLHDKRIGLMLWRSSNIWQSKLRSGLKKFSISLNEFIILESIYLLRKDIIISQTDLSQFSGVDNSVVSIILKSLNKKKLIIKKIDLDNRKKNIKLTSEAISLLNKAIPVIKDIENNFFDKLGSEHFNFINSLKIILRKKIRIKAESN